MDTPQKNKANDLRLSIDIIDQLLKEKISELTIKTNEAFENTTKKDELEIINSETETMLDMYKNFVELNIKYFQEKQQTDFLKINQKYRSELSQLYSESILEFNIRMQNVKIHLFELMSSKHQKMEGKCPDLKSKYEKYMTNKFEDVFIFCENSQRSFEEETIKKMTENLGKTSTVINLCNKKR